MSTHDPVDFPMPATTGIGAHYWAALREGRLEYQKCNSCTHNWLPPRTECPNCLGPDFAWQQATGQATLISWVVYHHGYHPWYASRLPYNVAVVKLVEGPQMISNIVAEVRELRIDMPLQLVVQREGDVALARFVPA